MGFAKHEIIAVHARSAAPKALSYDASAGTSVRLHRDLKSAPSGLSLCGRYIMSAAPSLGPDGWNAVVSLRGRDGAYDTCLFESCE